MLTVADVMFVTGWSERTVRRYLREYLDTQEVSVRLVSSKTRGRSYYAVDAESFLAAWPFEKYRNAYAELLALREPLAA